MDGAVFVATEFHRIPPDWFSESKRDNFCIRLWWYSGRREKLGCGSKRVQYVATRAVDQRLVVNQEFQYLVAIFIERFLGPAKIDPTASVCRYQLILVSQ